MEKKFWDAANDGKMEEVKSILRKNPSLNVNWKNEESNARTALYAACVLGHPDINPNLKQKDGWTPFLAACYNGNTSCVRLLLQDHRVMVNEPNNYGETPLKGCLLGPP